jgi:hypothetical protein
LEFADNPVALGVDLGSDVVRDFSSGVTQSDALVEGRRAKPKWAVGLHFL